MKKLFIILGLIIFGCTSNYSFAQDKILSAGIEFNWVNMSQVERDEAIEHYQTIVFADGVKSMTKKELRAKYPDFLKDKDYKYHYRIISNGVTETKDKKLCGFFIKDNTILYSYAIQYKNNPQRVFYYSAYGSLIYVDEISSNYPNFPYNSKQYRSNGKLAGAIYFDSKDLQYVFEDNGEFKGVWYKDKMFDRKGKQILTRSNW